MERGDDRFDGQGYLSLLSIISGPWYNYYMAILLLGGFVMGIPNVVNNYGWTVAVHGEFCTGCDARLGRCGELTKETKALEQQSIDGLKVALKGLLSVVDAMTPQEAGRLRLIISTGNFWFTGSHGTGV